MSLQALIMEKCSATLPLQELSKSLKFQICLWTILVSMLLYEQQLLVQTVKRGNGEENVYPASINLKAEQFPLLY